MQLVSFPQKKLGKDVVTLTSQQTQLLLCDNWTHKDVYEVSRHQTKNCFYSKQSQHFTQLYNLLVYKNF